MSVPKPKVFIVRDSSPEGNLFDFVSVWTLKPYRMKCVDGWIWRNGQGLDGYVESLWLWQAQRRFGTIPDDDIQMIVVG